MIEIVLMGFVAVIGITAFGIMIHAATRRGEDCYGYPYNCAYCRHAAECIIEIGRKKDDA